jgi:hypothetical protein
MIFLELKLIVNRWLFRSFIFRWGFLSFWVMLVRMFVFLEMAAPLLSQLRLCDWWNSHLWNLRLSCWCTCAKDGVSLLSLLHVISICKFAHIFITPVITFASYNWCAVYAVVCKLRWQLIQRAMPRYFWHVCSLPGFLNQSLRFKCNAILYFSGWAYMFWV